MSFSPLFGGEIKELATPDSGTGATPASEPSYCPAEEHRKQAPSFPLNTFDGKLPQFKPGFMLESEPHTPVEQIPPPPFSGFDTTHRFGSVSSIATTDDEEASNEIVYPWNEQQDKLVKSTYEDMLSSPQLTPFSGRYPPSGVLHRVAKQALKIARHQQIYFPHSMNAVRQRVIYFYHTEPENREDLQKYHIPNDYYQEDFDFTDTIGPTSRRLSVEDKYAYRQPSLQPAFREPSQNVLTDEDVINIVAKRKRDSLRIKRGPH